MRYPVMTQSLKVVREIAPKAAEQIIDIGVQSRTDFLMKVFPDRHHHLFEPSPSYHAAIEANYRAAGIDYTLHKIALSDADCIQYLHETSVDASGRVTHSQIRPERDEEMPFLVDIKEIPTRRLDTVFMEIPLPDLAYMVKLDVDGVEEQIIAGGQQILRNASFIIIETSIGRQDLCRRAALIEKLGYRMFDLCDNAYYYGQLALVDLVMINNRLRAHELKFRPWEYAEGKVHWKKWQHGFKELEDEHMGDPYA